MKNIFFFLIIYLLFNSYLLAAVSATVAESELPLLATQKTQPLVLPKINSSFQPQLLATTPKDDEPKKTDGMGIAAMVTGTLGMILLLFGGLGVFFGPPALVLGILSACRINKKKLKGLGFAIAGISSGGVLSAILLFLFFGLLLAAIAMT